jgi:RNA polymerase sigma-70 factor (ECF subfamily)
LRECADILAEVTGQKDTDCEGRAPARASAAQRRSDEWVEALRKPGPQREAALADLRSRLIVGLQHALTHYPAVDRALIEDCVQVALLKILDGLDSFRGASRFTTWAQAIAVHVALSEARRLRWLNVSLDDITSDTTFVPQALVDPATTPEKQAIQWKILEAMHRVIDEELTQKQRQVLIAVEKGMSLEEVARRTGSNRNALYKLLHDARQRVRKRLSAAGISRDDVRSAFGL